MYHHTCMFGAGYVFAKFLPGGHSTPLGVLNCFVHAFMYTYYFLTAFQPEIKKSLWWKKHITHVQMIQFALLIFHYGRPALFGVTCNYPVFWMWMGFIQNLFMFILFADFYYRAYIRKKKGEWYERIIFVFIINVILIASKICISGYLLITIALDGIDEGILFWTAMKLELFSKLMLPLFFVTSRGEGPRP